LKTKKTTASVGEFLNQITEEQKRKDRQDELLTDLGTYACGKGCLVRKATLSNRRSRR
jgi:hypothetical protein